MKTTPTETGSVSTATMNPRDLIPRFLSLAKAYADTPEERAELAEIETRKAAPGYYDTENACFDLEQLFDMLDEAAPAGHYFGAHPGDGADYGFWQHEDEEG